MKVTDHEAYREIASSEPRLDMGTYPYGPKYMDFVCRDKKANRRRLHQSKVSGRVMERIMPDGAR